jgi:integrase
VTPARTQHHGEPAVNLPERGRGPIPPTRTAQARIPPAATKGDTSWQNDADAVKGRSCSADGRWMASVDLGWQEGRRQRKSVYGRTRRAVAVKLTRVLRAVQEGAALPDERVTLAQFLERWLVRKQTTMRPRAWSTYEQAVRLYLVPGLGKLTLARLRPTHVDDWMRALQEKGTTARTIRYARVVLRAALNQARKWEIVNQNVAALVDPPRHTAKGIEPLNPVQARALLEVARADRLGGQLSIATALGLRLGESLGLRWRDVDFEGGTLSVRQAIERSGGDGAARRPLVVSRRAIREQIAAAPKRSAERRQLREELEVLAFNGGWSVRGSEPRSQSRRAAVGRSTCRRSWSRR